MSVTLWRDDVIVLLDWLSRTDLDALPIEHSAERQALADLLARLEADTDTLYGLNGTGLTQSEIDAARRAVSQDMGW